MAQTKKQETHPTRHKPSSKMRRKGRLRWLALALFIPFIVSGLAGFTATRFENHDSFCASCHTQPELEYYQRESKSSKMDLASFHTTKKTRCIDCHSGKGVIGRATALTLGARDLWAYVATHYPQPAPLTRSIPDANCLKCHTDVEKGQDFNNHFHIFLPKWQALDANAATCVDCHRSHTTDGDSALGYLNQAVTTQVCQECHNFAGEGE